MRGPCQDTCLFQNCEARLVGDKMLKKGEVLFNECADNMLIINVNLIMAPHP